MRFIIKIFNLNSVKDKMTIYTSVFYCLEKKINVHSSLHFLLNDILSLLTLLCEKYFCRENVKMTD